MSEKDDGGPAFALQHASVDANSPYFKPGQAGMTLRDFFVAQAMQALIAKHGGFVDDRLSPQACAAFSEDAADVDTVADYAYNQADAMLERRKA